MPTTDLEPQPWPAPKTSHTRTWSSEADCARAAQSFTQALLGAQQDGSQLALCVHLVGDIGAGKTTFIRYALQALGVQGRIKSPSYSLMEPYTLAQWQDFAVYHFDFYRFQSAEEYVSGGFEDYLHSDSLRLVEWPQCAAPYLPAPDVSLTITTPTDEGRAVLWQAFSAAGLQHLQANLTLNPLSSLGSKTTIFLP